MAICEICGDGPHDGVTVYRQNPTGEQGRWRCRVHNEAPVDPEVADIVKIIEDYNRRQADQEREPPRGADTLNLCPDHRDKATGRCIVCDGEKRGREHAEALLREAEQEPSDPAPRPERCPTCDDYTVCGNKWHTTTALPESGPLMQEIQRKLHPTDPTYCAELIDIDEARWLLAELQRLSLTCEQQKEELTALHREFKEVHQQQFERARRSPLGFPGGERRARS